MPNWQAGRRALACLALIAAAGAADAATTITLNSPAGEPLLGGIGAKTYTTPTATVDTQGWWDSARVIVNDGGDYFDIEFFAPRGIGQSLLEGSYSNAENGRRTTGIAPGIFIRTHNGECGRVYGGFTIRQFEASGPVPDEIGKLEATFTYRCDDPAAPALSGTILVDVTGTRWFNYSRDAAFPMGSKPVGSNFGDTIDTIVFGGEGGFELGASGQRTDWLFRFDAPFGRTFAKGTYVLGPAAGINVAGMEMIDNHFGACPDLAGTLLIRNVTYDAGGMMTAINATWTVTCDGQPATFRGIFRHDL